MNSTFSLNDLTYSDACLLRAGLVAHRLAIKDARQSENADLAARARAQYDDALALETRLLDTMQAFLEAERGRISHLQEPVQA